MNASKKVLSIQFSCNIFSCQYFFYFFFTFYFMNFVYEWQVCFIFIHIKVCLLICQEMHLFIPGQGMNILF